MPFFFHLKFDLYSPTSKQARCLPELQDLSVNQLRDLPALLPAPNTDIFSELPNHPTPAVYDTTRHTRRSSKGKIHPTSPGHTVPELPDWRFGRITVETIDMAPANSPTPKTKATTPTVAAVATSGSAASKARFVPLPAKNTEFGYGVIHLYRDVYESPELDKSYSSAVKGDKTELQEPEPETPQGESLTTVAILAVPSYMTPSDFMGFVGEETRDAVSHLRMVRTGRVNRYMVLMKFRTPEGARRFMIQFNGAEFNSMEPENCHAVYIKSIEFTTDSTSTPQNAPNNFPEISGDPFSPSALSTKPAPPPTPSLLELPTCPVCLERMDDTTGLLTILCQHVFHCACLSKWRDSSCPVCRYTQAATHLPEDETSPDGDEEPLCHTCNATENLWICLICGNIGCGRYDEAHAFEHFKQTAHAYAMDIETQRVWDYASDGYVHRLIQNKSDGKLVELPSAMAGKAGGEGDMVPREKLESIGVEYMNIVTSQLENQRQYFEEKLAKAADATSTANANVERMAGELKEMRAENEMLKERNRKLEEDVIPVLERTAERAETRAKKFEEMARKIGKEWNEEKEVNTGLLERVKYLDKQNEERGKEVEELKEQVRDLMFFLDSQSKLKDAGEDVQEGTVTVAEAPKKKAKGKGKAKR